MKTFISALALAAVVSNNFNQATLLQTWAIVRELPTHF